MSTKIGADAVDNILNIIAASMLAVTIFSLSTIVAAYIAASSNVTPRSIRLLDEDATAHNALGTFIGAFLFSLVGIIALSTGLYGAQGRSVLFVVTLAVIAFVVMTLLHWIDHVSTLGQVAETTERIERSATAAMHSRHARPYLGGCALRDPDVFRVALSGDRGARPLLDGAFAILADAAMVRDIDTMADLG